MPFVTEEIYNELPNTEDSIMITAFPEYTDEFAFEDEPSAA